MTIRQLLGSLPFFATALWSAAFYFRFSKDTRCWRWTVALASLQLGAFSLFATEFLSAFHLLSVVPIIAVWSIYLGIPVILLIQQHAGINLESEIARVRAKISSLPIWSLIILAGTLSLILAMGVASPPMNFDVQIYHLPRQIYWMMQGSVEPFAASHSHQISMPALAEFIGLNLMVLSGGDDWHNIIQFLFLLASCGLVTLLAKSIGGGPKGQIFSLLFVILVPVVFFEASNAKNDVILSFFLLLPLLIGIKIWIGEWNTSVRLILIAALGAGLALATKGTAVAYLIPPALLVATACIRQKAVRPLLLSLLPALLLAILPVTPQLMRNMREFHSPAGPNLHHSNLKHDPASIAGVALRNVAGQFTCDSQAWNLRLELKFRRTLSLLGVNPDDPSTTFEGQKFHLPYFAGLEDIAPAPVQTALLMLLPIGLLFASFRKSPGTIPLLTVTVLSLLFFCFIFRWQPWQGRLLIPAYFMAAPLAGVLLAIVRPCWLPIAITLGELLVLKPHLMFAGQRPLIGGTSIFRLSKEAQMSRMMPGRADEISNLVAYLQQNEFKTVMVDGGATEIYGLLRAIRNSLPLVKLFSGHANDPILVDAIIETTTPDAGTPPPPINPHPQLPSGFKIAWIGSYYRIFIPTSSIKN